MSWIPLARVSVRQAHASVKIWLEGTTFSSYTSCTRCHRSCMWKWCTMRSVGDQLGPRPSFWVPRVARIVSTAFMVDEWKAAPVLKSGAKGSTRLGPVRLWLTVGTLLFTVAFGLNMRRPGTVME